MKRERYNILTLLDMPNNMIVNKRTFREIREMRDMRSKRGERYERNKRGERFERCKFTFTPKIPTIGIYKFT